MDVEEICKLILNPGVTVRVKILLSEVGMLIGPTLTLESGETLKACGVLLVGLPDGINFTDEELKKGISGISPENSQRVNDFLRVQELRVGEVHFVFVRSPVDDNPPYDDKFGVLWVIDSDSTYKASILWFEDWEDELAISTLKTIFVDHKVFNLLDGTATDEMIDLLGRYQEFQARVKAAAA